MESNVLSTHSSQCYENETSSPFPWFLYMLLPWWLLILNMTRISYDARVCTRSHCKPDCSKQFHTIFFFYPGPMWCQRGCPCMVISDMQEAACMSGQKWLKGSRAKTTCFRQDELMRSTVTWKEQDLFWIVECMNKNAELETRKKWIPLQSVMLKHASCFGQSGEILKKAKEHTKQINDIQTSVDLTMFISASKDNTAKVSL